ncbi:hypothetical protein FRC05_008621 [Tulasnella sp. 425]|nr:hypothetical protein FRC05_008621 [Tulasnella sp. 425]
MGVEALIVLSGLALLEASDGDLLGDFTDDVGGIREPRGGAVREEMEDTLETAEELEAVEMVEAVGGLRTTAGGLTDTLPRAREEEAGLELELEENKK